MRVLVLLLSITLTCSLGEDRTTPRSLGSECSSHSACGGEKFCSSAFGVSEGVILPFSSCKPCAQCTCHAYGIDGTCPAHCGSPAHEELQLQGVWHASSTSVGCLEVWSFNDFSFTSMVFPQYLTDPSKISDTWNSSCANSTLYGGRKQGSYTFDTAVYPARLTLEYQDAKSQADPKDKLPALIRRASVLTACPEV